LIPTPKFSGDQTGVPLRFVWELVRFMAVGGNSETKNKRKEKKGKNMNPLTQFKKLPILPILLALGCFALPASAGTTQVSGIGVFNNACQPPAGSPPADLGDYPPIAMS